ncbi:MAG TPA: hypothetical protein PK812_07335 [Beijerinckiaceae bacterium]|nr:hypothetical protein [Beijerinckiaceae bacterium]
MAIATRSFDFDYAFMPFGLADRRPAPRPGFWKKLYDAMLDSRRIAAEREIRRHGAMLQRVEQAASRGELPF